jgi:anti-anti-sigma regulatory factor
MPDEPRSDRGVAQFRIVDVVPSILGEVDLLCVPELEHRLTSFADRAVAIDLSGVTFFDSSALRTFLAAKGRNP